VKKKKKQVKIGIQNDKFVDERDKYVITIDSPETNRFEDAIFYRLNDDETY
jgi:exoribonuclease R